MGCKFLVYVVELVGGRWEFFWVLNWYLKSLIGGEMEFYILFFLKAKSIWYLEIYDLH